jgi:OPA family glycerol-3-phosphate transporter-like MFS transporter/OPA family sugar phosphate sensor protein UhpC-like MFS transporter
MTIHPSDVSPHSAESTDEAAARFRYWQLRTLITAMFGYAAFYFVRKNLSFAMPVMETDLGIKKADLGLFLTLHGLLYGLSRFVNGMWADRSNARYFMVAGLLLSVGANVFFGFSSTVLFLGVAWMINGWVQGMGFPPCCRLMTHWFPPSQLATKMSIWNTSHSIGAAVASVFCAYIVAFGWRWCFFGPAILCTLAGIVLFIVLRDTPSSVGLPELGAGATAAGNHEGRPPGTYRAFLIKQVFLNQYMWCFALANFFVYILRFALLDWGPTLLKEMKHFPTQQSGWMLAAFEAAGLLGMLASGWATDRIFKGRGGRTCVFCMIGASLGMLLFWKLGNTPLSASSFLVIAGFFLYGPQALIGIVSANLTTRRAAAAGAGFTGIFGYASTPLSGWGLGWLVQRAGWHVVFAALLAAGALGTIMFLLTWRAKAHGYDEGEGM